MSLYKEWTKLMEIQTDETFEEFWEEYSGAESKIYAHILETPEKHLTGKVGELAEKFEVRQAPTLVVISGGQAEKIVNLSNIRAFTER